MKFAKRIISILFAMFIFLSSFSNFSLPIHALDDAESVLIRDDAVHFFIRHWHTVEDTDAVYQGSGQYDKINDTYFVIVEGYIMPVLKTDKYELWVMDREKNELVKYEEGKSLYLSNFSETEGTVDLNVHVVTKSNEDWERFCGFAISSGRDVVTYNYADLDGDKVDETLISVTIRYDYNTHLVKGHVFYSKWARMVHGSSDIFTGNEYYDTMKVYTYKSTGQIVYSRTNPNEVCTDINDLPDNTTEDQVELVKYYSTRDGLHTDTTVVAQDTSGRKFTINLEAWNVSGYAAQIGFILDASGSMAFSSDAPTIMNVYEVIAKRLNIEEKDGKFIYHSKKKGDISENSLEKLLVRLRNDSRYFEEVCNTISYQIGTDFGSGEWDYIFNRIGHMNSEEKYANELVYPYRDKMIGYYQFVKGDSGDDRLWFYNTIYFNDGNWNYMHPNDNNKSKIYNSLGGDYEKNANSRFASAVKIDAIDVTNGTYDFGQGNQILQTVNTSGFNASGWGNVPAKFSENYGMDLRHSTAYGFMPNIMPSDNEYTISFSLSNVVGKSNNEFDYETEVLYIGPKSGNFESDKFLRVTIKGSDMLIYDGYGNGAGKYIIPDLFGTKAVPNESFQTFTFVVDGDNIEVYVEYSLKAKVEIEGLGDQNDRTIIFAPPFQRHEKKSASTWIGDIFIYDVAFNRHGQYDDIDQLLYAHKIGPKDLSTLDQRPDFYYAFIDDPIALSLLLNPRNTDNTELSNAGYNYFILDDSSGVGNNFSPLAYESGDWKFMYWRAIREKTYGSISTSDTFTDTVSVPKNASDELVEMYHDGDSYKGDVPRAFKPTSDSYAVFFIDKNGNIRTFCRGSIKNSSYVYELRDEQYILTETAQRIIANFVSDLFSLSPTSYVSAVQFNTSASLLLDWSNNPQEIAQIMSLTRGNGKKDDYEVSKSGLKQYNYVLAGGTNTFSALQLFYDNLVYDGKGKLRAEYTRAEVPKFMVVITDGADDKGLDGIDNNLLKKLKDQGYTIIGVYLPNGVDKFGKSDDLKDINPAAYEFLTSIAGSKTDTDGSKYVFTSTDLDTLAEIFERDILSKMVNDFSGYTMTNYIDSRFNIVDSENNTWCLNAAGQIDVVNPAGTIIKPSVVVSDDSEVTIHISSNSTPDARDPFIRYNTSKDMYFLQWDDQNIPTNSIETKLMMPIWFAEYTLVAKDDFLGGNAILINGNEERMNAVYHPEDKYWSSGKGTMTKNEDGYASNGFHRAYVNVGMYSLYSKELVSEVYLGEFVATAQLLTEIEDEYLTESYYLEYLRRYAYQRYLNRKDQTTLKEANLPLYELLNEWLEVYNDEIDSKSHAFSIPYMYLPSVKYDDNTGMIILDANNDAVITNSSGNATTENNDVLGFLTYRINFIVPDSYNGYVTTQELKVSLVVEFTPLRIGDKIGDKYNTDGTTLEYGWFYGYIDSKTSNKTSFKNMTDLKVDRLDCIGSFIKDNDYNIVDVDRILGIEQLEKVEDDNVTDTDKIFMSPLLDSEYVTSVDITNQNRTIHAVSLSSYSIASGDVALELKMLIGELENACNNEGMFTGTFEVDASRQFEDNDFAESIKEELREKGILTEEYTLTGKYTFVFTFNYSKDDIAKLVPDINGYVTIFAKLDRIETFYMTGKKITINRIPIGIYKYNLDDVRVSGNANKVHFSFLNAETDSTKFKNEYFNESVIKQIKDGTTIDQYRVDYQEYNNESVTYYFGTGTDSHRGSSSKNGKYTYDLVGIIVLSTGTAQLTIIEESKGENAAKDNESFLFKITGKTLGKKDIDITVSVKGNKSLVIDILPGNYKVEEITNWSWRYDNVTEDYGIEVKSIPTDIAKDCKISDFNVDDIHLIRDDYSATLTFKHDRNQKVWLGGENYNSYN